MNEEIPHPRAAFDYLGGEAAQEAFLGALVIFLIQSLLAALGLTSLWLPLIYGSILVASLIIGSRLTMGAGMRRDGA